MSALLGSPFNSATFQGDAEFGSVTFQDAWFDSATFSGDIEFPGGVGNTRKDPEAFASPIHDVETKIFEALPDEAWVHPGHGNDMTLGAERPHLPEWRARGW
ncbi:pentapeptide repeat-containing protein [Streptomyces europaeiscabiei]|uniref:pentapeptide repeat-containing protein n=1 Tax=Streptomyces europaeiscabiei TaxID=146819 RepID=UPI000D1ACD9F|nr:pentapeptide repeat-containing protein [Streptomyces europaeiscabiei]MDX3633112.1 pentapeptide repeat-containing protein [Streptomyces europaeiscabiei]MDX3650379.1 pentapeptide repeat-containing protein [Streptomyces europaeiscabiei]